MPMPALTQAFQTALGMLITNDEVARGLIAGHFAVDRVHPDLNEADIQALHALLQANPTRLRAISMLVTQRRKRRILGLLPATSILLESRIKQSWRVYLADQTAHGAPPALADAAAFASSLLASAADSHASPFVLFELRCCEIGSLLTAKANGVQSGKRGAVIDRLRLSRFVRVERFEFAIDEAMREFRTRGVLRTDWPNAPTHLVFHPLRAQPPVVITTRLPATFADALRATSNSDGIEVRALHDTAPPELKASVTQTINRLIAMQVLEAN